MANYTKKDVVEKMRVLGGDVMKKDCERFLDLSLEAIIETLAEGKDADMNPSNRVRSTLTIVGFGAFEIVVTNPKRVHNPRNPEQKHVMPPHNRIRFRGGKMFNESVRGDLITT